MQRRSWAALATALTLSVLAATGGTSLAARAAPRALAANNGLAVTAPLMGWSSWSFLRSGPTAAKIDAQADAMKSSGLSAHGFSYINLDDFWMACNSNGPEVDSNGRWIANPTTFPGGIAAVAGHVHSDGLKFGLYVTPGIPENAVLANTPIAGTSDTADQIANTSVTEANYNCQHMYGINYSAPGAQAYINSWADEFA
jgi:alpha-galactosidase